MQVQRFEGPRENFELMLHNPNLPFSPTGMWTHMWERSGKNFTCTVFMENPSEVLDVNKNLAEYLVGLPIQFLQFSFTDSPETQETITCHVEMHERSPLRFLFKPKVLKRMYERYLAMASKRYDLNIVDPEVTNAPLTIKGSVYTPSQD